MMLGQVTASGSAGWGAIPPPSGTARGSSPMNLDFPWWCGLSDWTGGWAESCRVPTPTEIREGQRAEFGPAMPPAGIEEALDHGDEVTAAYCRMHPKECFDYDCASNPDAAGCTDWTKWALIAAVAMAALVLIGRR